MKSLVFIIIMFGGLGAFAQNPLLLRQTIGQAGVRQTATLGKKIVHQSFGQSSVVGTFANSNVILRQGFLQGFDLNISNLFWLANLNAKIYPNPFYQQVNVSFDEDINTEIQIEINDVLGKTVFTERYRSIQLIQLNLSELINATYFISVQANDKTYKTVIIKN